MTSALVALWATVAYAQVAGRDYVPAEIYDGSLQGHRVLPMSSASTEAPTVFDAVVEDGVVYVLYRDSSGERPVVKIRSYDPDTGKMSTAVRTVLTTSPVSNAADAADIPSAQLGTCRAERAETGVLHWDGAVGKYRLDHIGVDASTIEVTGHGGSCPFVRVKSGSHEPGYRDDGDRYQDAIALVNTGTCSSFSATYETTTCALDDPFHCAMANDPDGDAEVELGACSRFLVYEGRYDGGGSVLDRVLLLAHAQELTSRWRKWAPTSGRGYPRPSDALVRNTGAHEGGQPGDYSFVSVPALAFDETAGLWRMWFVSEDSGRASIRYVESGDDGQTWGIATHDAGIDCWDQATETYDTDVCAELEWTTGDQPPDDGYSSRSPDVVDPEIVTLQLDGDPEAETAMLFSGADRGCSGTPWGVVLFQTHEAGGDQSGGDLWTWVTGVAADAKHGVVMDWDDTTPARCDGASALYSPVMDPEVVEIEPGKYAMFVNTYAGVFVAGSGFACSNGLDDDGDGRIDHGWDGSCAAPTDDSE